MPLTKPTPVQKCANVIKTEQKGSDVNLASHLPFDAFSNSFECAIVVNGDSDLATPIEMARNRLNKPVSVLLPQLLATIASKNPRRSARLKQVATFFRNGIREGVPKASQFPDVMA